MNDCWNTVGVRGDGSCPELTRHAHCHHCPVHAEAATALLDLTPPDAYAAEWAAHYAQPAQDGDRQSLSMLMFRIGAEWFALASAVVEEVADMKPIHSIPHRRTRALLGITNVRGELLVCASLAVVLGIEPGTPDVEPHATVGGARLIVLRSDDVRAVCPVDEVGGIVRFDPRELTDVPGTLARASSRYSKQLLPWRGQFAGVLDAPLVCHTLKRSLT